MGKLSEDQILDRIRHELSPAEFERFVASLWELQGWETERTGRQGDEGKDIIAEREVPFDMQLYIQAKRHSEDTKVSEPKIREYALVAGDPADLSVVVTSNSFTEPAKDQAKKKNVKLVNSTSLIELIDRLDAAKLLTISLEVTDWEEVKSEQYIDWTAVAAGEQKTVDKISGIGKNTSKKLEEAGVHTVGDLLISDLEEVADQTELPITSLKRWRNYAVIREGERADVIDGIGQKEVEQLAQAGIHTVNELEEASATILADQIDFSETTLKQWIGEAVSRNSGLVSEIDGIGEKKSKELAKVDILTINELTDANREDILELKYIGESFFEKVVQRARDKEIDHDSNIDRQLETKK